MRLKAEILKPVLIYDFAKPVSPLEQICNLIVKI